MDCVKDYQVDILDTRKTTPAMRDMEKYAVRIGGGKNHRMGLYDQVLIKENHLQALQGVSFRSTKSGRPSHASMIADVISVARRKAQKNIIIEVEVKTIAEFEAALSAKPDIILLDNMKPELIKDAVRIKKAADSAARKVMLEASGNITLANVAACAATGVDRISIGSLTHSVGCADFSLKVL